MLPIEIIYIDDDLTPCHICVKVPSDTLVHQAVEQSGFLSELSKISGLTYAVFGQIVTGETKLKAGDRIEILRPLKLDPMTKRRIRAQHS